MAKQEHDREDLMNEATGYVRRVEFKVPDHNCPIFCGFRECGSASVYWTPDDVLQFNVERELRRGFWRGRMIACYKHTLTWVDKSEGRIRLQRTPLDDGEKEAFVAEATSWLQQISEHVVNGEAKVSGQVPDDVDVLAEVGLWVAALGWLQEHADLPCALHPGLGRRPGS